MDCFHKLSKELERMEKKEAQMMATQTARPRGTDNARVIRVIETKSLLGRGTADDPSRILRQYWDFNGKLLASSDPAEVFSDRQSYTQEAAK